MPYVPPAEELKRLRAAIDRASFTEAERIAWLFSFAAMLLVFGVVVVFASWVGLVGGLGAFAILYWRLRGGHLLLRSGDEPDRQLHGVGLRTRPQRAFTALMLRHAFSGRNPVSPKAEHDPLATWQRRVQSSG
jgi:hypothetical protein